MLDRRSSIADLFLIEKTEVEQRQTLKHTKFDVTFGYRTSLSAQCTTKVVLLH